MFHTCKMSTAGGEDGNMLSSQLGSTLPPDASATTKILPDRDGDGTDEKSIKLSTLPPIASHILTRNHTADGNNVSPPKDKLVAGLILDSFICEEDGSSTKPTTSQPYRVYQRRYWVLAIFAAFSMSNAFQWIEFAIVGNVVSDYYGVDRMAVDWTSMIYMVSYVPLIFPAAWFLEKYGLRRSLILGCAGTGIGAWLKVVGIGPDGFTWIFVGQTFSAFSQVFVLGVPPHLAAQWFGPNELSTATAIGVFGNLLGIGFGFLVPPILVPESDDKEEIRHGFTILHYAIAGFTTVVFVLILFVVRDRAPSPPSHAQAVGQSDAELTGRDFLKSLAALFKHRGYVFLSLAYGINLGVLSAISTLLNPMLLANYPGAGKDAGFIGAVFVICGMVGCVVFGVIMDKTHKYKETALGVYIMAVIGMAFCGSSFVLGRIGVVYAAAAVVGIFMTGYLPVGFEFAAEITYPHAEGTTSGFLNASSQIFALAITGGASVLLDEIGTLKTNSILCGLLLVGSILTYFVPNDLRRRAAHKDAVIGKSDSIVAHHRDSS